MSEPEPTFTILLVRRSCLSFRPPRRKLPQPPAPAPPPSKPRRLPIWAQRPQTRGECLPGGRNEARPCPFASCRHSLLVDIDCDSAEVRETAEDPATLPHTCSLDVAEVVDAEDRTVILRELYPYFGVTRERIRQLELRALDSCQRALTRKATDEKPPKILMSPWGTQAKAEEYRYKRTAEDDD